MIKKTVRIDGVSRGEFYGLMVCAVFFTLGVVMGTFSARTLDTAGTLALRESMTGRLGQIVDGTYVAPGFFSVLEAFGRDHLIALFLGFSLLGVFGLPVLSGVRGFSLSFSIAAFLRAFGPEGLPVALSLFGLGALITIPCFFLLSAQAFGASARLGKLVLGAGKVQSEPLFGRRYWVRLGFVCVGIFVAVLLELYATPVLVAWAGSFLF